MTTRDTTRGRRRTAPHHVVVAPDGVVVPPAVVARLARRLAESGLDAVVAPVVAVPPGSTAAEVAADGAGRVVPAELEPLAEGARVRGAAVVREGVAVAVDGPVIDLGPARAARDPGAVATEARVGPLGPAVAGRPGGRSGPVILVCAATDDAVPGADALVRGLLDQGADARLAAVAAPEPSPWHTACTLDATAVEHLRPDVVVADPATARRAETWCTERWTTVVEQDTDLGTGHEVLPWSAERPRLRARVGPGCPAEAVAALARRLAAGPQPVLIGSQAAGGRHPAPGAGDDDPAPRRRPRSVAAVLRGVGPASPVVDAWPLIGVTVRGDASPPGDDDLLVVGAGASAEDRELATRRAAAGRPTLAVVAPADLTMAADGRLALGDGAARAVAAAGRALVPSTAAADAVEREGADAQVVPATLPLDRLDAVEGAAVERTPEEGVVGWLLEDGSDVTAAHAALATLLHRHPTTRIEVVGDGDPAPLTVTSRRADLDLAAAARWAVAVWSPLPGPAAAGAHRPLVELALLGVAVAARPDDARWAGALGRDLLPLDVLAAALDPTQARRRGQVLRARAAALHGGRAAVVAAHRALGWALHPSPAR